MHLNAQTIVELDRKVVHSFSGSDQHVAIATSITNVYPPSSMFEAIRMGIMNTPGVCGCGRTLDRENMRFCRPGRTLERERTWFCGSGRKEGISRPGSR